MPLYLTYDNTSLQDGLGAQSLRIMGIFSLARFFGIRYLHSPIDAVIEEFSHGLNSTFSDNDLIQHVNEFFKFPSSKIKESRESVYLYERNISLRKLLVLKIKYMFTRRNIVIRVLLPFYILDKYPGLYRPSIKCLRRLNRHQLRSKPMIVAHVRWGYGWKYSDQEFIKTRRRLLPFEYYSDILEKMVQRFRIAAHYNLVIHTDLSNQNIEWMPLQKKILRMAQSQSKATSSQPMNIEGYNLEKLIRFPRDCKVHIHYCSSFFHAFLDMCNAEYLVMGSSAFSYVAALLNENTVVWPDTQGHSKRAGWYASSNLGKKIEKHEMCKEGPIEV